jgi:hypothetical protein
MAKSAREKELESQIKELEKTNVSIVEQNGQLADHVAKLQEANQNLEDSNADLIKTLAEAKKPAQAKKQGPGFLVEKDDPFGAGTLRTFAALTGEEVGLPFVIPYTAAGKSALENYILRASGASDRKRVNQAKKALKKCKEKI